MQITRNRVRCLVLTLAALLVVATPVGARVLFDPGDPALAGSELVPFDASSGLTRGLQMLVIQRGGTTVTMTTTHPNGFCDSGVAGPGCVALDSYTRPGHVTITFSPAAAAVGVRFVIAECAGVATYHGAAIDETVSSNFQNQGRFNGAADIGDIASIELADSCYAAAWSELRFVPGTGGPPPVERADLSVTKRALGPAQASSSVTYDITIANAGPDAARGVTYYDFLPFGSSFVSSLPVGAINAAGDTVTVPWSDFANGASGTAQLTLTTPAFGAGLSCDAVLSNVVIATSSTPDPNGTNNVATLHQPFDRLSRASAGENCTNAIDDDCDGLNGCADYDCLGQPACALRVIPGPPIRDGSNPYPFPLDPNGAPLPLPGPPPFDPQQPLDPDTNWPPPQPCERCNIHGTCRTVAQSCCDPSGGHGGDSGCEAPADPNFKESVPAANAVGVAFVSAGQRIDYTVHYENIGLGAAHDVVVFDFLDPDLDDTTLSIEDGGVYDATTRELRWVDALLPPLTARAVHYAVNLRANAPGNTRARNVATIIFPDAVPPSRIDTNVLEHVVLDPAYPVVADPIVVACHPAGGDAWSVELSNRWFGYAYDVTAEIVSPPSAIHVTQGRTHFAHADVVPSPMTGTVVPFSRETGLDLVRFTSDATGNPCRALTWRIAWNDSNGTPQTRDVQLEPDRDADAVADARDNCPTVANPGQQDVGGLGAYSGPDGVGDACQCGDVTADGRVTVLDAVVIRRSLLTPPTASQSRPDHCDVGGSTGCTASDSMVVQRALLLPPTATIDNARCVPALP